MSARNRVNQEGEKEHSTLHFFVIHLICSGLLKKWITRLYYPCTGCAKILRVCQSYEVMHSLALYNTRKVNFVALPLLLKDSNSNFPEVEALVSIERKMEGKICDMHSPV